jgi:hypothetical protein
LEEVPKQAKAKERIRTLEELDFMVAPDMYELSSNANPAV